MRARERGRMPVPKAAWISYCKFKLPPASLGLVQYSVKPPARNLETSRVCKYTKERHGFVKVSNYERGREEWAKKTNYT